MSRENTILKVKEMIIKKLDLPISVEDIQTEQPLFGEGLGLDSIDSLEIIVGLEKEFGVKLSEDEMQVLYSVETIVNAIVERTGA